MPNEKLSEINEHDAEELIHYPQDEEQKERRSRLLPGRWTRRVQKSSARAQARRRVAEKTSEDHAYLMLGAVPFWAVGATSLQNGIILCAVLIILMLPCSALHLILRRKLNLAEWVDRTVLGRFRDAAVVENGQIVFAGSYRYTWILSSLNFGVTVLTGVFAGHILKSGMDRKHKWQWLLGIGVIMVALGWLWGLQLPVIKKIWTSSMVLVSSGYCFLLMGLFYYWIDYKGHRKNLTWLKVYGMNSIVAYMLANVISFRCIGTSLFHGLEQYTGNYYPALIAASNALIIYVILWLLYKRNIFLKV